VIQFEFQELENNYHLKLSNINLRNETLFNVINFLISIQNKFLKN
jgi:DNA-directed RNA polymerase specialized sigma54-like protein